MKLTQEQKLFQEIVQRAWESTEFKEQLVANPVATIEKFTGRKLNISKGKKLVVRDQTNHETVYINIPSKIETQDTELNEDQLELVAGGVLPYMGVNPYMGINPALFDGIFLPKAPGEPLV